MVYEWQKIDGIRKHFHNPEIPSFNEHRKFWKTLMEGEERELFIVLCLQGNYSAGYLRLDMNKDNTAEISVLIIPRFQGKGAALSALKEVRLIYPEKTFLANVREANTASVNLFLKAGFRKSKKDWYVWKPKT